MTRPTQIGRTFPLITATGLGGTGGSVDGTQPDGQWPGSGQVPTASGSNTWAWASNVAVIYSNTSNALLGPFVNFNSGSGVTFAASSNTLTISTTASASAASNALLRTTGGAGAVTTIASSGSAKTLMIGGANTFDITLTANCTISVVGPALPGSESSILLILRQDGMGSRTVTWPGSVTWATGSAPTLSTTGSAVDFVVLKTVDGGSVWFGFPIGGSAGTTSPLTTKGDLYTYSTTNARLAVGSNGTALLADSAMTTGNRWSSNAPVGEILITDTPAGSPLVFADLIQNEAQDDLLYADLGVP